MMLSNWKKKLERKSSPIIFRQIDGLIFLLVISTSVAVVASVCLKRGFSGYVLPYAPFDRDCVAVELRGFDGFEGVYCISPNVTLLSFLNDLDLLKDWQDDLHIPSINLREGMLVTWENGQVVIGEMSVTKKLALGVPLDINKLTYDELLLIPGIKGVTAQRIIELRERKGGQFSSMSELLEIKGIKEKRLEGIKRYLRIDKPSR